SCSQNAQINIVNPLSDSHWDQLVSPHSDFTFFHSSAWLRVISNTYGHKCFAFQYYSEGELKALVPLLEVNSPFTGRRGVCLPFTDFCHPLFFGACNRPRIFENLCAFARERGWNHIEFRGKGLTSDATALPSKTFYGHSLDLQGGVEHLFAKFKSSVRRAIRRAEERKVDVQFGQSEKAMRQFYGLHLQTRRRHGLPPQPFGFFQNIHDEILRRGSGFVCLASSGSKPIAGAVFFHMGKNATFKFGASDPQYQDYRSNNLVMWRSIEHLVHNGFENLHLGRTSQSNEGLRRFKLSWATVEEPLEYFRFNLRTSAWTVSQDRVSGMHNAIFSRLPLALNRIVGTILYPHLD
ncbi:MAG TPA: GNAT family N-acetyltransferase, partial [Terrimicrobiaceae bacterium]